MLFHQVERPSFHGKPWKCPEKSGKLFKIKLNHRQSQEIIGNLRKVRKSIKI